MYHIHGHTIMHAHTHANGVTHPPIHTPKYTFTQVLLVAPCHSTTPHPPTHLPIPSGGRGCGPMRVRAVRRQADRPGMPTGRDLGAREASLTDEARAGRGWGKRATQQLHNNYITTYTTTYITTHYT